MSLNSFAASSRLAILASLQDGSSPGIGAFDPLLLAEARVKGTPQMGTTRYEPDALVFEFVYSDQQGASIVLPVRVASPERIVFLPVPDWVVESIWQGEIDGSYHFESDATRLVQQFCSLLEPSANAALFGPRMPTHRE